MLRLSFSDRRPALRKEGSKEQVFCPVRRKWIILTPEEWVRQHILIWLEQDCGVPLALTAVEKQISIGELNKRFDIVVYDRSGSPFLLMECKQMEVELDFSVLRQVLNYNIGLPSTYLAVTNGRYLSVFGRTEAGLAELEEMPVYPK
jgi:hypothetical protein